MIRFDDHGADCDQRKPRQFLYSHGLARRRRPGSTRHGRGRDTLCALLTAGLAITGAQPAWAFDDLSEAQKLIYATPHLTKTSAGQSLTYAYTAVAPDSEPVTDTVVVHVHKERSDSRRDVSVEFLHDDRTMTLPAFDDYQGNPVIIAMLEHNAQQTGKATGGGGLYFRNRIRDALADRSIQVQSVTAKFQDKPIETKVFSFQPYLGDPYLAENQDYSGLKYQLTLSDDVPGGVVAISISSTDGDGDVRVAQNLSLQESASSGQ